MVLGSATSSRRTFIKTVAAGVGAATLNPLGLFGPRSAFAGIPSGEYMRSLTENQFWFQQLRSEAPVPGVKTPGGHNTPGGQLSIRLGLSGGFAIGYFNTLGFLSDYREQLPNDYRDLIVNIARLPKSPSRTSQAAHILETHRKYGSIKTRAVKQLEANRLTGKDSNRVVIPPNVRDDKPAIPVPQALSRTLESLSAQEVVRSVVDATGCARDAALRERVQTSTVWDDARKPAQAVLEKEFKDVNDRFETDFNSLDAGQVVRFSNGKLDLSWLDHALFPVAFKDGIENGRIAALAYMAMVEAGSLLDSRFPADESAVTHIDKHLVRFSEARLIEATFGDEDFWSHGLDVAAFRPAVRLKTICVLTDKEGAPKRIELLTPFLPFDVSKRLPPSERPVQEENHDAIASAVKRYFSDTAISRLDMPITTQALPEGSFDGCGEVFRHTSRLLRATAESFTPLIGAKLELVTVIPEVTSPWTFAGVGGALFNGYLTGLRDAEKLANEEERIKFKWSVSRAVDDLLQRSVRNDERIENSSAPVPSMVQYASGYRAANLLADGLSDKIAQSDGARKVYGSLVTGMPEFFKALEDGKFLTAEEIAGHVLQISAGVQTEVNELRLRVRELESILKQYQKFNEDLSQLISKLTADLSGVTNRKELDEFKQHATELLSRMRDNLDASQAATLNGMQGLINTFGQVGVNIEASVRAKIQTEVKINIQFCSVGGAK
jgi:hypothetical protein